MFRLIRNITSALMVTALLFGVGRGVSWLSGTSIDTGLSGPVQVLPLPVQITGIGGYSALIMQPDGRALRAGSDHGFFLDAQISRDATGHATGLDAAAITPVLSRKGGPLEPFHADLEGLTPLPGGALGLAYESYTRLLFMPPPDANGRQVPKSLHGWQMFEEHFGNFAFEAIATLPSGDMLAILERKPTPDTAQAYIYTNKAWRGPHLLPAQPGWAVSGADVAPDGCLYVLERRYRPLRGFQTQLVRLRGTAALPFDLTRELVWRSAPLKLGNGEGLSLWAKTDGSLIASLITDDGFPPPPLGHPTQLIELPLQAAPGC